MTYGEIKDVIREHFGRVGWPTFMLDQALAAARRDIEKQGNYYWMRSSGTFNTSASTATYAITSGTINKPNFKDLRALHIKESSSTFWTPVDIGNMPLEEAKLAFATDDEDMPTLGVVDNATLYLFPIPDDTYNCTIYHFEWTSNQSNLETDELSNRFPDALIYGALAWGCDQFTQAHGEADRWRALYALELQKIHKHDFEREQPTQVDLMPMRGPFTKRAQIFDNLSIWR